MRKTMKKCLSILMVVAIIFSSAFAGLDGVGFSKAVSLEVKAAGESNKDFDDVMYVEQENVTCDGKLSFFVYLKAGIKPSGIIINVAFDDEALSVIEGGACTAVDDFGDPVPVYPGMYECGMSWQSTGLYSFAYVNTTPPAFSSDIPFMKITFSVNDGYNVADVKFTCVEFSSETGGYNITKQNEPVVMLDEKVDVTSAEHISSGWIQYEASVFSDGLKYHHCIICRKVLESIVFPQLVCEEPELSGVVLNKTGLLLSWKLSQGADSYGIYRKTETTTWEFLTTVGYGKTNYLDTDVEDGVVYYYTVTAVNEAGESSYNTEGVSCGYHQHKFGSWETVVTATCSVMGKRIRSCICGATEIVNISTLPHNYSGEWTVDVEPTCNQEGSKSHHCVVCEAKGDVTSIPVTDHKYSDEWTVDVEATCIKEGSKSRHCTGCETVTDVTSIPVTDHKYSDEWTIDVEPTCSSEGSKSHHCIYCEDKTDITVLLITDHKYEVYEVAEAHPHPVTCQCIYCGITKIENTTDADCLECNFIVTYDSETNSYILESYIGNQTDVDIPAEYNGGTVTEIALSCFRGKTAITSVKIPGTVKTIGSFAFMNCYSLEGIYIPSSVTSIADNSFYGIEDAVTIYCYRGSTAREYAIENDIDYVLMNIVETEDVIVDFENELIFSSITGCVDPTEFWVVSDTAEIAGIPSLVDGNTERYGTGSTLTVFDNGKYIGDFTLIVIGDLNGDSVCDVLDASAAYLYSAGMDEPSENEVLAANGCISDELDASSYQNVINIMLS